MTAADHRRLGAQGEDIACRYLADRNFRIIDRNVHYPFGEIDIIAIAPDGSTVFCEVKTRSSASFGGAAAVDNRKLNRLRRAAAAWLKGRRLTTVRFDVIELIAHGPGFAIEHYEEVDSGAC